MPTLGDWALLDLVQEDGTVRRVEAACADPARQALVARMKGFTPRRGSDDPLAQALASGIPRLVSALDEETLRRIASSPEHEALIREIAPLSLLVVPLLARDRSLGVLTLFTAGAGRRYGLEDLALAEELARRAALAVDNARLFRRLEEANATLRESAAALAESDRRKDEFLATLAHELRNPLAPIRNALEILRHAGPEAPASPATVEMMERQVRQMVRLIDDLLDISRISRGRIELRREPIDLASAIAGAVETARPLIEASGHELTVRLPERPVAVEADPSRLAQLLGNLLDNAAKYTDRGGRIEIAAGREGDAAVVRVRDNGIGIPAALQPGVFEMFTQGPGASGRGGRRQGGLGVGLALVKSLVELHGGSVEVASAGAGQGCEFVVRLPLAATAPAGGRPAPLPASPPVLWAARRTLVVDDNRDAADSLALLLEMAGGDVRTAYDGPSALEAACAHRPEVIVLDIGMPGMDGYEVARRLRRHAATRGALLIALTGWGHEEDVRRAREAGFDHHLVKPAELDVLRELLERREVAR